MGLFDNLRSVKAIQTMKAVDNLVNSIKTTCGADVKNVSIRTGVSDGLPADVPAGASGDIKLRVRISGMDFNLDLKGVQITLE